VARTERPGLQENEKKNGQRKQKETTHPGWKKRIKWVRHCDRTEASSFQKWGGEQLGSANQGGKERKKKKTVKSQGCGGFLI